MVILPKVKKIQLKKGYFQENKLVLPQDINKEYAHTLAVALGEKLVQDAQHNVHLIQEKNLLKEGYRLEITDTKVIIFFSHLKGLFYSGITLKHLRQKYGNNVPKMCIEDAPDFPVRGVLYDVSRNKVPRLETLYKLVEILADLKYNQLQLYLEGPHFEYGCYENILEEENYITKEEMKKLQAYCQAHFIDLVPNQNTLGHMREWLEEPSLKHLALNPEGEWAFGMRQAPATLNPSLNESFTFVKNLTNDLLPSFDSKYYNVNLDECFGLEDEGTYTTWIHKMQDLCVSYEKNMMMWSDMLITYEKVDQSIPQNVTLLDWGYEDHYPFNLECSKLQKMGHDFYVCPGTSAWLSLTGRTDNMLGNVNKAIECAKQYGAKGIVMTEWGDGGHWQTFPIGLPGFVYAGAKSWNTNPVTEVEIANYLDAAIFKDSKKIMGNMALEAGRCYHFGDFRLLNGSMLYHHLMMGLCDKLGIQAYMDQMKNWMMPYAMRFLEDGGNLLLDEIQAVKEFDFEGIYAHLGELKQALERAKPMCKDGEWFLKEYETMLLLTLFSVDLRKYLEIQDQCNKAEKETLLKHLQTSLEENCLMFRKTWLWRNKLSDLEQSMRPFKILEKQIKEAICALEQGGSQG